MRINYANNVIDTYTSSTKTTTTEKKHIYEQHNGFSFFQYATCNRILLQKK